MKLINLLPVLLLLLLSMLPQDDIAAQEISRGQAIGEAAGEILMNSAMFSEEEKEIFRRYYRGSRAPDDDWRTSENDVSSYHWDRNGTNDDTSERVKSKKHNGKKKGGKNIPPGLAKKNELPAGLKKQLEKNGTLPPGLAKRDLPDDLVLQLPLRPRTQERTVIDEDIVLIERATGRILDILYGGARRQ